MHIPIAIDGSELARRAVDCLVRHRDDFGGAPPVAAVRSPRDEIVAGLRSEPARIEPKFFYDVLGSRLFEAITALPEYYLTRAEAAIFDARGAQIASAARAALGPDFTLIDLGAGSGAKAARLFRLLRPARYVAVDIALDFLRESLVRLQTDFPSLPMTGVVLDFSAALRLPDELRTGPALVFFAGSTIGNFAPADAQRLLREALATAAGGALLIGVDLVKDAAPLEAAYDDALGVTAAFNLNVLRHVNRLAGTDFDVRDWRHVAFFDARASAIEMHLQAQRDLVVRWRDGERRFAAGERIGTEHSYKWTVPGFAALLRAAGFAATRRWTDPAGAFAVFLARA